MTQEPFLLDPANRDFVHGHGAKASGYARYLVLLGALFLLFGVLFLGVIGREWYTWSRLRADGAVVDATVTKLNVRRNSDATFTYEIEYSFDLPGHDGAYTQRHQIGNPEYCLLKEGEPVKVQYSRSDPSYSRTVRTASQRIRALLAMTTLECIWLLVSAVMIVGGQRARSREQYRAASGRILAGQIIGVRQTTDSDGDLTVEIDYGFHLPDGSWEQATATGIRNDLKGGGIPEVGTPVRVLFADGSNFELL